MALLCRACFKVSPDQDESTGILICKLGRTNIVELNEEATCIQLAVIWKVDRLKIFHAATYLIEHDKSLDWDRDKLMKLTEKKQLFYIQHCPVEEAWLIYDNIVLKTRVNITYEEECYKLEMTVSETSIEDGDAYRPWYFDIKRCPYRLYVHNVVNIQRQWHMH
jgi:hypothetical protein